MDLGPDQLFRRQQQRRGLGPANQVLALGS